MSEQLEVFDRGRLAGPSPEVAPDLLNALLVVTDGDGAARRVGRIVEVEAYAAQDDPASHAHRGPTPRTESMFGAAGTLYTYLSYGIHTCANIATGAAGTGQAVLLRALEPLEGLDAMQLARPAARREVDLANGPGKLCAAMGVTLADDGLDTCSPGSRVVLCTDHVQPPADPEVTTRIGISAAVERPWRFVVPGSAHASRHRGGRSGAGSAR